MDHQEAMRHEIRFVATVREPWFTLLQRGLKKVEGRLRRNQWAHLQTGDLFRFLPEPLGEREGLLLRVVSVHSFQTFADAWEHFGEALIPSEAGVESRRGAIDSLYGQFYSDEEVRQHGVVAVEVALADEL